ncbi:MAG: hypothetical protein ABIB71_05110 [Candidatus Woesearchaeota archaeon]
MRDEYWLLLSYSFILLAALLLVGLPALSIVIGLLAGFAALAWGYGTPEHNPYGDMFINFSKFFWKHWIIMLAVSVVLSVILVKTIAWLKKRK